MKVLGSKILVEVEPLNEKVGSFFMPEKTVKQLNPSRKGRIVQLGDYDNFEVSVGEEIVFNAKAQTEIDETHVIIPNSSIFYVR